MAQALTKKLVPMMGKLGPVIQQGTDLAMAQKPKLLRFWSIAKVEFAPPSSAEMPKVIEGFKQAINVTRISDKTMKDVMLNTAVCVEIYLLYQMGRILGKRALFGFNIPGTTFWPAMKRT